jgi:hypothetical protein
MTTITIDRTDFSVNAQGVPQRVVAVWWFPYLTQSGVTETLYTRRTEIAASYAPANIAYETVTEADCTAWVTALEADSWSEIDSQLNAAFAVIATPRTGSGVPWQDIYPLWVVPLAYSANDVVIFENLGYECLQAHTSQIDWQPPLVPALWKLFVPDSEGPQPWVQPTGAQDAYQIPDQVTHNGHLWECNTPDCVWEPGVFGWTDLGVYP